MKDKKNLKIFLVLIVAIIIILIGIAITKYNQYKILMNIVAETHKVTESGNYYYEVKDTSNNNYAHIKLWVKGDYSKMQNASSEGDTIRYVDLNENKVYFVDNIQKTYYINNMPMNSGFTNFPHTLTLLRNDSEKSFIDVIFSIKEFKTENIDNKECYKIRYETDMINEIVWVDKDTLLPIKNQNENDLTANYTITVNTVTDNDVVFTNIGDYTLLEQ